MPTLKIDDHEVTVEANQTLLDAAAKLGLEIPTLCYYKGYSPNSSCLACVVKDTRINRLVPACATVAQDGMTIESGTDEVHQARRMAVELLLSDHVGDCMAPCQCICPAGLHVPRMLRAVADGNIQEAIATLRESLPLAAALGRLCTAPCENGCRRKGCDDPAAIQLLERFVADSHLAMDEPSLPDIAPPNGKRIAILPAGPLGLSAAYDLLRQGYLCTVYDHREQAGGVLRYETDRKALPKEVLDAEITLLGKMGLGFIGSSVPGEQLHLTKLQSACDAVLIDTSELSREQFTTLGGNPDQKIDKRTGRGENPKLFFGGHFKGQPALIRSVAEGKQIATCIDRILSGREVNSTTADFTVHIGKLQPQERDIFLEGASNIPRVRSDGAGLTPGQAQAEARRCLHCDCHKADNCRLREVAQTLQADPHRYKTVRRSFERRDQHGQVLYEPGKCIDCGLCLQVSAQAGEALGLTFIGRGFDVRIGVPFDEDLADGLQKSGRHCVNICPTGALAFKDNATCPREATD